MKLFAISDIHLGYEVNRRALLELPPQPEDWLILAGDVGETTDHLEFALRTLRPRFRQLLWVPGNHDLWSLPGARPVARGEALYRQLVDICRSHGTLTPEDPYVVWEGDGPRSLIAPLFLLYDYSFRPPEVERERAVAWAVESGILAADENFLHPDPYPTRDAWCEARCRLTESRLESRAADMPVVLINHFPLRQDLVRLPAIPRFSLWCGTRRTENWHRQFGASVVVSGHLHIRATDYRDGVRFEEVSLGYPHQWKPERGMQVYLREILPGPAALAV
jgi:3',5'-cyclic AMP phosphodiesterase CpdA